MPVSPSASTRTINTITLPFGNDLVFILAKNKTTENIMVSPIGVQACMALVYIGAQGETSKELEDRLKLGGSNKVSLLEEFAQLLSKDARGAEAKVIMANRLYLDEKFKISAGFNEQAQKYLDAEAVNISLANATETVQSINAWVEAQTAEKIQNIIGDSSIPKGTEALLVNAMHLQAKWATIFNAAKTSKKDFFLNDATKVEVDMMYQRETFVNGYIQELDAHVIELNFSGTNIALVIVLPKVKGTLSLLEDKLRNFDITKLTKKLKKSGLHLYLPKFEIECDISLRPVLEKVGIRNIFTQKAELSSLLAENVPLAVGLVQQKIVLEIHELGTDANAKSSMQLSKDEGSAPELVIDHPFFFVLNDNEAIYFTGHIAKL